MMTKLEAVNEMLAAIGESAISSLSSGIPDAESAEATLDRVSRRVQAKGWHCNTEDDFSLARDFDGRVRVPSNALRVDTWGTDRHRDVTVRTIDGVKVLYDRDKKTSIFDRAPKCSIVWELPFEDLTTELQMYIVARACVEFQQTELSSAVMDKLLKQRLNEAEAALMDAETEVGDYNILRQSPYALYGSYRINRLWGL